MHLFRTVILLLLGFLVCATAPATGASPETGTTPEKGKDDIVVLDNGDHLTGEIVSLSHGLLYFKSQRAVGTLELDWTRVVRLHSKKRFEFESERGIRRIGRIGIDQENKTPPRMTLILDNGVVVDLDLADILGIREMQPSLLGRLNLSLEAGVTYTSGNEQIQINTQASLKYDHPRYSMQLQGNSLLSDQTGADRTSRHELQLLATRYLSNDWNYMALATLLSDAQQDLDLRATFGGGVQRFLHKSSRTIFSFYGGLVYTNETYSSELESNRSNAEILTGLSISSYKFRSSELSAYTYVFPSVSDPGRIRADSNAYLKWEIVSDLYWKLSVFDNFDSEPPPGSIKNNFGTTSSIGWSF